MAALEIRKAPQAFKLLNGIVCLYKDRMIEKDAFVNLFRSKLAEDLNKYEPRPVRERIIIEGSTADDNLVIKKGISYADHPLVVGPRYKPNDIEMSLANEIETEACGLIVAGIGPAGVQIAKVLSESNFVRTYEVKAKFGRATNNFYDFGKTIEKSTWKHIRRARLDTTLSKIVAMHQKMIFKSAGVGMDSQEAYELAALGPTRPISDKGVPLIYSHKLIKFDPPEFTFRMQTINEQPGTIGSLVNGIGIKTKSNACITNLRCTRYGHFTVENSLLEKDFNVESALNNISLNIPLTTDEKLIPLEPRLHSPAEASKENLMKIIEENKEKFTIVNKPLSLGK